MEDWDILGDNNISSVSGNTHKNIRGSAIFVIGPSAVKDILLPRIDKYMKLVLQNWDGKVIELQEKTQEMAFFLSFKHVFGDESSSLYEAMKQEFDKLVKGPLSLPINLPGTNYRKGLQVWMHFVLVLIEFLWWCGAEDEAISELTKKAIPLIKSEWDKEDADLNDVKDSWEDEEEPVVAKWKTEEKCKRSYYLSLKFTLLNSSAMMALSFVFSLQT